MDRANQNKPTYQFTTQRVKIIGIFTPWNIPFNNIYIYILFITLNNDVQGKRADALSSVCMSSQFANHEHVGDRQSAVCVNIAI